MRTDQLLLNLFVGLALQKPVMQPSILDYFVHDLSWLLSQLMRILEQLHVSLKRRASTHAPVRPLVRQFLCPPTVAMELSTDVTERVRMSSLQTERVWLTIIAEGLGAS
jgi:hypothetical protein